MYRPTVWWLNYRFMKREIKKSLYLIICFRGPPNPVQDPTSYKLFENPLALCVTSKNIRVVPLLRLNGSISSPLNHSTCRRESRSLFDLGGQKIKTKTSISCVTTTVRTLSPSRHFWTNNPFGLHGVTFRGNVLSRFSLKSSLSVSSGNLLTWCGRIFSSLL